jgi:hypothetical protein
MTDKPHDVRRGLASAHSMHRTSECSGSLALINRLRQEGRLYQLTSPEAAAGTRIHQQLAGKDLDGQEVVLSTAEARIADLCQALAEETLRTWRNGADCESITEQRFWWRQGLIPRFSAQPDVVFIDRAGKRALVQNFKTGRKESQPEADNLQLRTEIVCLWQNEPELERIDGAIIEPLVSWDNERVTYNLEALRQAENEILAIVDRALWNSHERNAGVWCIYCPARANCPEARKYIESIPTPRPGHELWELPRGGAGTELWLKIQNAEKILKSLEAAYERILEDDPNALPGLILPKEGRARRIVPDPALLKAALAVWLTAEEIDGCAEYHVAKIQEVFGLKHKLEGKKLSETFWSLTEDVVEVLHDKPFIRPLTKKEREQPAKIVNAETAFK